MSYISEAIEYLTQAIIYGTIVFLLLFFLNFRKNKEKKVMYHILSYGFVVYIVMVLLITRVISSYGWHFAPGSFAGIEISELFTVEKFLNMILFIPLGFFLPLLFDKKKISLFIGIGVLFSCAIELIQYFFVGRLADGSDIIANSLGCTLGVVCSRWIGKLHNRMKIKKEVGVGTIPILFNFFVFVFSLPVIEGGLCLGDLLISRLISYKLTWSECDVYSLDFSGIHYTMIFFVLLSVGSFLISKRYKEHFLAHAGQVTSILLLVYSGVMLVCGYLR